MCTVYQTVTGYNVPTWSYPGGRAGGQAPGAPASPSVSTAAAPHVGGRAAHHGGRRAPRAPLTHVWNGAGVKMSGHAKHNIIYYTTETGSFNHTNAGMREYIIGKHWKADVLCIYLNFSFF